MPIQVQKVAENLHTVTAKAPECEGGEEWNPTQPIDGRSLAHEMMRRRFHPQDICDAIAEADPQWNEKLA